MKKEFSKAWKSSKRPGKQRKYVANAPLHIKRKFLNANLSKDLRKKHNKRSISLRKGDVVKIMKGKFKGKRGKITEINLKNSKIIMEGIQVKKQDGSKANIKLQPSNLQIIELNIEDKKRLKNEVKSTKKIKQESSPDSTPTTSSTISQTKQKSKEDAPKKTKST
tara:strand:+ start:6872 stop:7366 length:495 start_codon:yes stop_codon:yes gene_type:complete